MWYYFNGIYGITFYTRIFENIFEKLKPYRLILRLGGIKEVIRMSDEAIRELFRIFVEEGELDEEQAERILQRILDILFGDRAESEEADE